MNKDLIQELNELRAYLEITDDEFDKLLFLAINFKNNNSQYISDELLYRIMEEALVNMDYNEELLIDEEYMAINIPNAKTIEETFNKALNNLGYQKVKKIR